MVEETLLSGPNSQSGSGVQGCDNSATCSAFGSGGGKGDSPSEDKRLSLSPDGHADGISGTVVNTWVFGLKSEVRFMFRGTWGVREGGEKTV